MSLKRENREYDPWNTGELYVLSEKLIADGYELSFGDKYPEFCHLAVMHTHFNNGVIGTKDELDSLQGHPLKLYIDNGFMMPIAMFVANPHEAVPPSEFNPNIDASALDEDEDKFYMENAELLKTKKDLIGYAKQFKIKLPNKTTVSIKKMLEILEQEAKKKGLLD